MEGSRIEGVRELNAVFEELGKSLTRNNLKRVGIKALNEEFVPVARSLAPDDPRTPDPDLESSIVASDKLNKRQKALNRQREDKSFAEVYAGTNDPAGVQNEFGNSHQAPQPFMRPALMQTTAAIFKNVASNIWEVTMQTVARKAKRDAARTAKAAI